MPGLTPIGPIAATVNQPAANPIEQGFEEYGLFVLGDANDVHQYSGMDLGTRWLCRIQGPICDQIKNWPTPGNETWRYHPSEEAARTMYTQLRGHVQQQLGANAEFRDARAEIGMNAPSGYGEGIFSHGQEIGRIFFDQMADMQIAIHNTNCIRRTPAHPAAPDGPALVNYLSQSDVLTLAIAKNARGVAEHVVICFSPTQQAASYLAEGMIRAERPPHHEHKAINLVSGFLVAFWGRASGPMVMSPTRGGAPGPMLHQYLGNEIARPLHTNVPGLDARLPAPAAYAIRVEPGTYDVAYYEMDMDADNGGFSFVALSKQGAPSFQPASANGGGRRIGGMTMDEYAMMTVERDRAMQQFGMSAGNALAQICQKYNQPIPQNAMGVDTGYAARIVDWDKLIQNNPALSAQFLGSKQVAAMRLQGIEPSPEQISQIMNQQQVVAQQLQQGANAHQDATKQLTDGAAQIIEMARTLTPEQIIAQARTVFSIETQKAGTPAYALGHTITILKQPGYKGNPKFNNVDQVTEKLALAHYRSMKPEDQKFEGNEKSYVKGVIADVYEKNGVAVPGVGGFLNRFMDKL